MKICTTMCLKSWQFRSTPSQEENHEDFESQSNYSLQRRSSLSKIQGGPGKQKWQFFMNGNISASASNLVLYPGSEEHDKPQALRFAVSGPNKHGHSTKFLTTLLDLNDTLDIFQRQMHLTSLELVSQGREITRIFFLTRVHKHTLGELVRVSLQGVHLAKSTFPASCLPLQAGNIAKMFEITRGNITKCTGHKIGKLGKFCCHVEHQIKCCLHTPEGNNR